MSTKITHTCENSKQNGKFIPVGNVSKIAVAKEQTTKRKKNPGASRKAPG
jgi:hypothetical protein